MTTSLLLAFPICKEEQPKPKPFPSAGEASPTPVHLIFLLTHCSSICRVLPHLVQHPQQSQVLISEAMPTQTSLPSGIEEEQRGEQITRPPPPAAPSGAGMPAPSRLPKAPSSHRATQGSGSLSAYLFPLSLLHTTWKKQPWDFFVV